MEKTPYDFLVSKIHVVAFITTDANWKLNRFAYDDWYALSYVISGSSIYIMDNETAIVKENSVVFFPPKRSRAAYAMASDPWKFIVIKFSLDDVSEETKLLLDSIPSVIQNVNSSISRIVREIETAWRIRTVGFMIQCKGLLYTLIYQLIALVEERSMHDRYHDVINDITSYIMSDVSRQFSIEELAGKANMSPSYFRTVFKRYTGQSPIQYQISFKMHYAYNLLCSHFYRVAEVAKIVGIQDEYYFSRMFKKVMGFPPSYVIRNGY